MDRNQLKFAKTDEWVSLDGDIATIGISDYAVKALTDLVFIQLPKQGQKLTQGQPFGEVESVKAVSDLYSPVSGTVTAVNEALKTEPDKINSAPHETWIIKVELSNAGEVDSLLDAAAYESIIAEEQ